MKVRNENLTSIDAIMDAEFGNPGTPEREEFRKEHMPTAWDRLYVMPERRKR